MGGLEIQQEDRANAVVLTLGGTLDGVTARELRAKLATLRGREVAVDFSRLTRFQDTALAVLAGETLEETVRLLGLAGHQERMFRYFGFLPHSAAPRAYYPAEERLAT